MKEKIRIWIGAMRLFSLPMSVSAVMLGAAFAFLKGNFSADIFALSLLTVSAMHILCNLANDYGDAQNGADGCHRTAPRGTVATGLLSQKEMFWGVVCFAVLSVLFSALLIYAAFGTDGKAWLVFGFWAFACIYASIRYTMGKNPYGYKALGDISVFIFFGLTAVLGSCLLYGVPFAELPFLPACSAGFLATAVLNANNIRDMESDFESGKNTVALYLGHKKARLYHVFLVGAGILCWAAEFLLFGSWYCCLLILLFLPAVKSAGRVFCSYDTAVLDNEVTVTAKNAGLFQFAVSVLMILV